MVYIYLHECLIFNGFLLPRKILRPDRAPAVFTYVPPLKWSKVLRARWSGQVPMAAQLWLGCPREVRIIKSKVRINKAYFGMLILHPLSKFGESSWDFL